MLTQFNPPHPGSILREDVLPALEMTVTEAALSLGVTRAALSRVLNEQAAISPEMALRIEKWLGVDRGGQADNWLAMQAKYDLWQARRLSKARIKEVKRLSSSRAASANERAAAAGAAKSSH